MFDNRREIMQDVFLTYLPAQRFKTSRMTVQLIAPLQRETAAATALLPAVLAIVPVTALVMAVTGMVAQKCAGGKEHKNG